MRIQTGSADDRIDAASPPQSAGAKVAKWNIGSTARIRTRKTMHRIPLAAALAAFVCAIGGVGDGTAAESQPPELAASDRAASKLQLDPIRLPSDLFPVLPWDTIDPSKPEQKKHSLESIAECNFTLAGFVRPEDLPQCERLGLAAIVARPSEPSAWFPKRSNLSAEEIGRRVKAHIERAGQSKAILGYYLMDEPGAIDFPALAAAVAAVKQHAPGKLAYINLFPGYATVGAPDRSQLGTASFTEYLERFVHEVRPQFLSYDNYMVQYSDDLNHPPAAANYFRDLLEVRRVAAKYGLPFWNIVSSNQIRKFTTAPSPANLNLQSYTTLAAGGRSVSWYKYFHRGYEYAPIDAAGDKTLTWHYLRMVNQQLKTLGPVMNRLQSTGVYFSAPPLVSGLPLLPGKTVAEVSSRASPRGHSKRQPPVMVGEFVDETGADHVMVVNLSLQASTNIRLRTQKPYQQKRRVSAEDGRLLPLDERNGFWLVAGQGVLIRLD